jgi:DNA-binding CsgD family transcriptional regulator
MQKNTQRIQAGDRFCRVTKVTLSLAMELANDPNDRRRVDTETQRNRDAEVARMRRDGVSYRTIASRLDMSLGAVQKSLRRAQRLADALAGGEPGDVVAAVCDDELRAADVACVADIERLSEVERYRLRHMPGPFGDIERARPW